MTTYTGPTPYDDEGRDTQNYLLNHPKSWDAQIAVGLAFAKAEGYRRGFADAKAEAAPLLEALQRIFDLDGQPGSERAAYLLARNAITAALADQAPSAV